MLSDRGCYLPSKLWDGNSLSQRVLLPQSDFKRFAVSDAAAKKPGFSPLSFLRI